MSQLRYPGLRPFDEGETRNFFGRDHEIKEVCRLLDLDRLVILHGTSGMGKSSLINAGILPDLAQIRQWQVPYKVVPIRFTNYDPGMARLRLRIQGVDIDEENLLNWMKDPIDRFVDACVSDQKLWKEIIPMPSDNFWLAAKILEVECGEDTLRIVFVLDQFEELFTYPEERVEEFGKLLGELYQQFMPESVRKGLERKKIIDASKSLEDFITDHTPEESAKIRKLLKNIHRPLDVKMIISMRSDKLSYLERFRPFLPEMLTNSFELRSFTTEQATRAIVEPALLTGDDFASPPFSYPPELLAEVLEFLKDEMTKRIDPSQLQIICQNIERRLIKRVTRESKKQEKAY